MTASTSPKVIVLGALSAIAEAAARKWAAQDAHLLLVGRDRARLEQMAADLRIRGATAEVREGDLTGMDADTVFAEMAARLGAVDVVLLAYGILGDQRLAETSPAEARRIMATDFTSAAAWCLAAANLLETQRRGALIVIGSVAGDRGRASNYVYGAAKGGLGILVQGLAHRLARSGARAVLIRAGFVTTPMTAAIPNKGLLWASPQQIADVIVQASAADRSSPIVYAPWFWRWIMYVVRFMPSAVFHRTRL